MDTSPVLILLATTIWMYIFSLVGKRRRLLWMKSSSPSLVPVISPPSTSTPTTSIIPLSSCTASASSPLANCLLSHSLASFVSFPTTYRRVGPLSYLFLSSSVHVLVEMHHPFVFHGHVACLPLQRVWERFHHQRWTIQILCMHPPPSLIF